MKILVINGPNLNMLGIREKEIYGDKTYQDLKAFIISCAEKIGVFAQVLQYNSESEIIDSIQSSYEIFDGIIINPAAFSHTSIAILDALKAVNLPCVEVHLSDITKREEFRKYSYVSLYAFKTIMGQGFEGYKLALDEMKKYIQEHKK